uniref:Cytochrome c oxidase assembly protein COX19 n=1 Tax=Phascolarctos cinereus TaxID=38626 RepID=A0A6P5JJA6_PHACI|nr:cytochrome c oxidase assembly protein COX19 isoform X1 [Phascolarctos cinereus]
MSTAMNFGTKSFQPRPPDKGSFPLDHFGECKAFKEKFLKCLRDNNFENTLCRNESKEYLECRMERPQIKNLSSRRSLIEIIHDSLHCCLPEEAARWTEIALKSFPINKEVQYYKKRHLGRGKGWEGI